jgi:hypothetical protein
VEKPKQTTHPIRTGRFKPSPEKCCFKCIFKSGQHSEWCEHYTSEPHLVSESDKEESFAYWEARDKIVKK